MQTFLKNINLKYYFLIIVFFGVFFLVNPANAQSCNCDVAIKTDPIVYAQRLHVCTFEADLDIDRTHLDYFFQIFPGTKITKIWVLEKFISIMARADEYYELQPMDYDCSVLRDDFLQGPKPIEGMTEEIIIETKEQCESFTPYLVKETKYGTLYFDMKCKSDGLEEETEPEEKKCGLLDCEIASVFSGFNQLDIKSDSNSIQVFIGRIIKYVLGFTGSLTLAMFVMAGLIWMTARGNSERTAKALKIMTWASLGTVVILSSYVILDFIFGVLK